MSAMQNPGVTTGLRPDSQTMSKVGITMEGRVEGRVLYADLVKFKAQYQCFCRRRSPWRHPRCSVHWRPESWPALDGPPEASTKLGGHHQVNPRPSGAARNMAIQCTTS